METTMKPPAFMSKECKAVWRKLVKDLPDVENQDWRAVERYCEHYVEWQQLNEFIVQNDACYMAPCGNWRIRPQAKQRDSLAKMMRAMETDFGLSPKGRKQLKIKPKKTTGGDEATFLGIVG